MADPALLLPLILVGFLAQLVDGALGMAYGQISSTLLIALGVQPKFASASVHTAECFTTGGIEEPADEAQWLDDARPFLGMAVHDAAVEQVEAGAG